MRYLLFDADQTLYDFNTAEELSLKKLFDSYKIPFNEEMIRIYNDENNFCWEEFEKGRMKQEELKYLRFERFFNRLELNENSREAGDRYIDLLSKEGIMLNGAIDFLEQTNDFKKSLITNGIAKVQRGRIAKSGTEKYFEHIFISEEIDAQKPSKDFFDIVLDKINIKKEECIVIGDSEKSDILGAINAGIESIYISFDGKISTLATYSVSSFIELEKLIRNIP